jgi:hypothetical protein
LRKPGPVVAFLFTGQFKLWVQEKFVILLMTDSVRFQVRFVSIDFYVSLVLGSFLNELLQICFIIVRSVVIYIYFELFRQ